MSEIADAVHRWRAEAIRHAADVGASVAALATSPLPVSPTIGTGERYSWMAERYGLTAQEQLTCGCHVHVSVESDEEGVAVLDRVRGWLPVLLALSANSPSGRRRTPSTPATAAGCGAGGPRRGPWSSTDRPSATTSR